MNFRKFVTLGRISESSVSKIILSSQQTGRLKDSKLAGTVKAEIVINMKLKGASIHDYSSGFHGASPRSLYALSNCRG